MRYAPGPRGVLVLLGLCLALQAQVKQTFNALEQNDKRRAAVSAQTRVRADALKKLLASMPEETASQLKRIEGEAFQERMLLEKQDQADLVSIALGSLGAALAFHLGLFAAAALMLYRSLPMGAAWPVFAAFGFSLFPFLGMLLLYAGGLASGGERTEWICLALLAAATTASTFFFDDAFPFLRRIREAARRSWPLLLTPWILLFLAYSGAPWSWTTLLYLTATAILTPVNYSLAESPPRKAAPLRRAELMY